MTEYVITLLACCAVIMMLAALSTLPDADISPPSPA
jgi:hypothetical protein